MTTESKKSEPREMTTKEAWDWAFPKIESLSESAKIDSLTTKEAWDWILVRLERNDKRITELEQLKHKGAKK